MTTRWKDRTRSIVASLIATCAAGPAAAQVAIPASTQFDLVGFLQEATVDRPSDPRSGGTLTVNGHRVIVPANTIVILPASALTWQELFASAPAPYTGVATGLALADLPAPLTTYEVHVIGNRVLPDAGHPTDAYVAGLVYLSQQELNSGGGYINYIDYSLGEMRVGGLPGDPTTGTRVRINDPIVPGLGTGRFSKGLSPDTRFSVDQENPTIKAATGYPMCLPRTDPAVSDDPLCPQGNRLRNVDGSYALVFTMPDPAILAPGQLPDPRIQAPFEVGDHVTFAGTVVTDLLVPGPTVGPYSPPVGLGTAGTYVSAHTIEADVAIYTFPGTNPAYVSIDVTIVGTGGQNVAGAAEAAFRERFEGMTTDASRIVHLYGIDYDPATGASADRDFGMIGVDPGPAVGAVKGRWRYRPPCVAGGLPTARDCTPPPAGTVLPAPREVRAVLVDAATGKVAANAGFAGTAANGIVWGQYHAPVLEYIFPENIPGAPRVENNFGALQFLANGGYSSVLGTVAGPLDPWPGRTCAPITVSAGGPYTVASGGSVTLDATATGTPPFTFSWGTPRIGTLANAATANPVYTAPAVGGQTVVPLAVSITSCGGTQIAQTTVTINSGAPTVNHIAATSVTSGTPVSLTATGTDPNGLPLAFTWTQTGGTPIVLSPNPFSGATVAFTPTLAVGQTTQLLTFSIVATNSAGVSSAPDVTTVTVNPVPDTIAITAASFLRSKQRLTINAASSVVAPTVVLKLQPYLTTTGVVFDPCPFPGCTFTNNGGGLYVLDVVGAMEPANPPATPLSVSSNLGGLSPPSGLTKIR